MIRTIIAFVRRSRAAQLVLVGLAVALLIFGLFRWADRAQDSATTQARDAGAAIQRAEDLHQSIQTIERAKDAQETIRRDDDAARAQCLRWSRTPENC